MPVSIYGQCPNMDAINAIAEKYNLPVIEDAAQSFGATYKGKKSCNLSTIGSTSFFPSKPLGCYGDGGALFTNDDDLVEKFRWIRVHGQERKHYHPILGLNGRMDTIQAAILLEMLEVFPDEVIKREALGQTYTTALVDVEGLNAPCIGDHNTSVYAQYTILSNKRDDIQNRLKENDIPSVSYYSVPLHLQPVFEYLGYKEGNYPEAERVANYCLSLPMNPYLSLDDQFNVIDTIQRMKL
jgi:UDP-2-acetamido-2-deoxy-ribo-hexuluronate aminotransferase